MNAWFPRSLLGRLTLVMVAGQLRQQHAGLRKNVLTM